MDLFAPDLSSSIPLATSRNKGKIKDVDEILRHAKTLEAQLEDFGNKNKDFSLNVSKDKECLQFKSPNFQGKHRNLESGY